MAKHPFLSEPWLVEAEAIRASYDVEVEEAVPALRMNLMIGGIPFGEGSASAHVDSSGGRPRIALGHLDGPDVILTTDYQTARTLLIEADPQAGIEAFMAGKLQVQGDMTKLLLLMQQPTDPVVAELRQRIREITE